MRKLQLNEGNRIVKIMLVSFQTEYIIAFQMLYVHVYEFQQSKTIYGHTAVCNISIQVIDVFSFLQL
jgi:hypothetical protein